MSDDRLNQMREELDAVDEVAVHERPELFDRVHRALVSELNALEEVS